MVETTFKITGLDCLDCARGLESSIAALSSVEKAEVGFFNGTLTVSGDVDKHKLREMITALGYGIEDRDTTLLPPADETNALVGFWRYLLKRRETRFALIAGGMVLLSLGLTWIGLPGWVAASLQIGALALAGWPVARSGFVNLWVNHAFNLNFLMAVAGVGAVVIGEYAEAASMILLFSIAEALEGFTHERARGALSQLKSLEPTHALKVEGGQERSVPVEALVVGDDILVRPGDCIPLDGVILEGQSDLNQAPVTGESIPVWKQPGDEVLSGTVNGQGQLIVEVTRLVPDSTLHRIIEMVTEAQSRRSRRQQFIDRFAQYYTPAMVVLAILLAAIPPLLFQEPFLNLMDGTRGWLHRSLALLVISCPCALVISTPVTMVASLTRAVKEGVLFKGSIFVEALAGIRAFAFDKTGTLTRGEPEVIECRDVNCQESEDCDVCDDLLALAYALERHSAHPLAQAVIKEAERRDVTNRYPAAKGLIAREGRGLEGDINGRRMTIGSLRLFEEEHDIPPLVHTWVDLAESGGRTAMLLCDGDGVRGFIAVADTPRTTSRVAVKTLKELGKHTVMLTGDNETVASVMGTQLGLDGFRASLLPGEKQEAVSELHKQYGAVCMVGDGINDAPALAAADLGIAMGGSGNAQAMETADVVLMGNDLQQLPFAVRLSKFANRLVRGNIAFSLGSKLTVAVIALFGYAPLWLAVLADMGVSLLVTLNGLRALRFKS